MKINNDLRIALDEAQARRKNEPAVEGFEALLADKLGQSQGVAPGVDAEQMKLRGLVPGMLNMPVEKTPAEFAQSSTIAMQELAVQIDSLFSEVDEYADQLRDSAEGSLKNAYSSLQGLSERLAAFKAGNPGLAETDPQLSAMVNELDVLTTTEMFKFNRGDYL